ncbi:hypothetical protein [Aquipuribacter hungaricus]|uniref:Uncharacterized protein n=1 Tax=Aquipuribacter hungaricus TaxID=545624 RepID=A0ABV7WI98_9MICO
MRSSRLHSTGQDVVDDDWGRVPGLRPPLPRWAPAAWFLSLALVLTVVVVLLVRPPGPLDQPDPANQRNRLLLAGPSVAPEVAGVDFGGRPVVLLFDRDLPDGADLERWVEQVPAGAEVRLVVPGPVDPEAAAVLGPPVVVDPEARLAAAVDLPTPVDGGPGVGYAVVDSNQQVRYFTLDPVYLENAFEIATIVGAVP